MGRKDDYIIQESIFLKKPDRFSAHPEQPKYHLRVGMPSFKSVKHRRGYIEFYLRKAALHPFFLKKRKGGI